MKRAIVFLEQQSWTGGAQRVLESTLDSISAECDGIVAFPDHGPFRSALEQRNVVTMDLPIGNYRPGGKSVLEMAAFVWRSLYCGLKLAVAVRRRRIALIYVNGPRLLPAGVLAGWLTGRPTIFHLHLILERRPELMLVCRLARRVSRILACSQAAAAPLLDRDPRLSAKTQVLYNPVRPSQESRKTWGRSDCVTVGMVGRITEKKGQHLLLQAVSRLPRELRERVRLLIVGAEAPGCESDARYAKRLKADSARYGLSRQIVFAGYQPNAEACYASMDVLVHPASSEAMCLVILEALDRGIPVIAFRTGGIVEVVQDGFNGLLVSKGDERELSRSLALYLESCDVRERLRAGASRGLDRRFSMETFSPEIRTAINQVCGPGLQQSRTALVHHWLVTTRGGERVFEALAELFPTADVFTLVCDKAKMPVSLRARQVRSSFLQHFPKATQWYRYYLPFFPFATERLNLKGYDVIISSDAATVKGVRCGDAMHICYCHTPMRYVWSGYEAYHRAAGPVGGHALKAFRNGLCRWDYDAAQRVTLFVANSRNVQKRIKEYYGRESSVIYPPVDTDRFTLARRGGTESESFLVVSQLVPYKRVDLLIDAFNECGRPLTVIGDGPERRRLESRAGPTIRLLGDQSDVGVVRAMQECRAFVFAGEEDFGIVMAEAQACGKPVIALGRGGAVEIVSPGRTGILFEEEAVDSILGALDRFDRTAFDPLEIRESALRFGRDRFLREFSQLVTASGVGALRHG